MKKIDSFSLSDLAPPSIKSDENVKALISAIDSELLQVSDSIPEAFIYARLDTLSEALLDLLAWQWHVDFYDMSKNIDVKREMIRESIKWHRHKGTSYAIVKALEMLGIESRFIPWYEDPDNQDNPYTFAIEAKLTGDFWERVDWAKPTQTIRRAIVESKSARSYMSKIYIWFEDGTSQNLKVIQAVPYGGLYQIKLRHNDQAQVIMRIGAANSYITGGIYKIKMKHENITAKINQYINSSVSLLTGIQRRV